MSAAKRSTPQQPSSFVWDVLLGRIVPAILFAIAAVAKARAATVHQAAASESVGGAALFAGDLTACLFWFLLGVTYLQRLPRLAGRRSPLVIVVTLVPLFALFAAFGPHRAHTALDVAGAVLVALGTGYALVSLAYLRLSFSILPEARALVTAGPFALSRHPIYLGEAIAAFGLIAPLADARVALLVPYLLCQWIRLGWEEAVLVAQFPEYADYAARVPRVLPFLGRARRI